MKILVLAVLATVTLTVRAQQPEADPCHSVNYGSPMSEVIHCLDLQRQRQKEIEANGKAKIEEYQKAFEDGLKAMDNANKLRSHHTGTQIDGLTDSAKDTNSHANSNPASKQVTDKSLSLINQVLQTENDHLDSARQTVETGLGSQGGSSSSDFNAGQRHEFVERPHLTIQQQVVNLEQQLRSEPNPKPVMTEQESARSAPTPQRNLSLEQQVLGREDRLLASPSTVRVVANRDRAVQAAEQAQREKEAKEEAARLAALAVENQQIAEAKQIEEKRKIDTKNAELKALRRQEWLDSVKEMAAQQAAWKAMYGQQYGQTYTAPQVPDYYSSSAQSYSSSFGSAGSYAGYSGYYAGGSSSTYKPSTVTKPTSDGWNPFTACGSLPLVQLSACLQQHADETGNDDFSPVLSRHGPQGGSASTSSSFSTLQSGSSGTDAVSPTSTPTVATSAPTSAPASTGGTPLTGP